MLRKFHIYYHIETELKRVDQNDTLFANVERNHFMRYEVFSIVMQQTLIKIANKSDFSEGFQINKNSVCVEYASLE